MNISLYFVEQKNKKRKSNYDSKYVLKKKNIFIICSYNNIRIIYQPIYYLYVYFQENNKQRLRIAVNIFVTIKFTGKS